MTLPLLTSKVIPRDFVHGFTTRAGGVSAAPWDSLNVGRKWGDAPANVDENRRRILAASGASKLFLAQQVHGARATVVAPPATESEIAHEQADALVVAQPGWAVGVIVADCVPILLADPETGACAAVHAGWRGTVADVAGAAVRALVELSQASPARLTAALGPSIGPCCFEVGDEVVDAVVAAVPGGQAMISRGAHSKPHVDLWAANRALLERAGVHASRIDALSACTHCDPGRFFSYRREGAATGQMMAFIRAKAPPSR